MLKNRNLSIAKLIGGENNNEYEIATVIASGNKTVDIKMLTGGIYRRVPVSGSANVGDQVNVLFLKGKPNVIAGGSSGSGATQIIINSGIAEAPVGDYAPSPHDAFGSHHSWPSNAAGQFLVTTGIPGSPNFRNIILSDISPAADTRYALRTITITAGDGLTGGGSLAANFNLAVNPGHGIELVSDAVKIKLNATASGLSLNTDGLAIADTIAGSGIGISTDKILSVAAATTISDSVPAFTGLQADADGLRIYASSAPGAAQHVLASNNNGRLTLPLFLATTSVSTPSLISGSGLSLTIASADDTILNPGSGAVKLSTNKVFQSDGYASQTTGMRITHLGEGDFRYIYTDELHAKSFIADLEQALAGGQIITKSVAVLFANYTLPSAGNSSSFTVQDLPSAKGMRVFEVGDFIGFRQFDRSGGGLLIGWAWGTVSAYVDNLDGTQSWTFTRSASPNAGIASGTINKDSIVLDFGKTGNGYHEVNAIDGLQGANSPYSQIVTWDTHPRTRTVRTRLGNLRGVFGASGSSVYSLVIQNATGGTFLIQIDDERTGAIAYNAADATVATAINGIIAGATVSLVISGTTRTYTITIPSTYSYLPFSVNGKNVTGTSALDFACTLTSQTNSEFGLYAGKGTGVGDTYIRISDTTAEFRNTPIRLYDGSSETMRLWAGSATGTGNSAPSFAMGSPLPTGPLATSAGAWMGLSGGSYQFRIGVANGTALTSGMHWTGSQLNIIGAIRLSGTTYATPTDSGLYADSGRIGYYSSAAAAYRTYMDSNGNFYLGGTSGSLTWTASSSTLNIQGSLRLTGTTYAAPSASGLYGDSSRLGYYNATVGQGGWRSWFDSGGNLTLRAGPVASGTSATGIVFTSGDGVLKGGYYTAAAGPAYGAFVTQWQTSATDGSITAASGRVIINSNGISIDTNGENNPFDGSRLKFVTSTNSNYAHIYSSPDGSLVGTAYKSTAGGNAPSVYFSAYQQATGEAIQITPTSVLATRLEVGSGISTPNKGDLAVENDVAIGGVLEAQKTQLMRYKYGPSGFGDANTVPYLQYTVTSNTGGYPYGSFFINFAGRDGGSNTTQELWYFQVYRNYQGAYVWSSQRVAGTANVFARIITSTTGTSPNFTGTLTIRWWVGSVAASYNDGLEITVMELSSGLNAGHLGTFSVGSSTDISAASPTSSQQGNTFAGTIIATDKVTATNGVIVPASNNSAVFALDASSGTTASLGQGATYFPFSNANNFSGMIMVTNTTNNAIGLYLVGSTSVSLISDTSGSTYTATSGTANRINLYLVSGAVVVQQNIAGTRVIRTVGVRMGTSV